MHRTLLAARRVARSYQLCSVVLGAVAVSLGLTAIARELPAQASTKGEPATSQTALPAQAPQVAREHHHLLAHLGSQITSQIGRASWYGRAFQGKKTATGEKFDMNRLTCAHRTLPLGSWVRVTNLRNRLSIFVRVNDRGPVPSDRVVDLSYAAAQAVQIDGTAPVKLERVRPGDPALMRGLLAQFKLPALIDLIPTR
jgi:rare lipoprotein A (peptidoglycan hydrolase)